MSLASIPDIIDVELVRGQSAGDGGLDLVIEIPHGATQTADYERVARRLTSPLPEGLVDFFHVNTDAGAPELGLAIARAFVAADPRRAAAVLRCRIPRTLIDCNRQIDASPEDFKAGKVSPGLMPWITTPEDRALLRGLHAGYVEAVHAARDQLHPRGAMLLLHPSAPRTVDVEVDLDIVKNLRAAYQPDKEPTWPLRPELDVIGKGLDGTTYAPPAVVDAMRTGLAPLTVADGATYPLHPSTQAYDHVMALPGRALCVEVRRDLLADPFEPFAQMRIAPAKVDRLAGPMAQALRRFF
jgi:hypothetical protein